MRAFVVPAKETRESIALWTPEARGDGQAVRPTHRRSLNAGR
jgi:hypothetical protein